MNLWQLCSRGVSSPRPSLPFPSIIRPHSRLLPLPLSPLWLVRIGALPFTNKKFAARARLELERLGGQRKQFKAAFFFLVRRTCIKWFMFKPADEAAGHGKRPSLCPNFLASCLFVCS